MLLLLICDKKDQILHLLPDVWSERHKPAINPMHDGLKIVSLPWILRVEQLKVLLQELGADGPSHRLTWNVGAHHELQEELVHQLEMGPRFLKVGLVLIGVYLLLLFVVYKSISQRKYLLLFWNVLKMFFSIMPMLSHRISLFSRWSYA